MRCEPRAPQALPPSHQHVLQSSLFSSFHTYHTLLPKRCQAYVTATRAVLKTASSMLEQLGAKQSQLLTVRGRTALFGRLAATTVAMISHCLMYMLAALIIEANAPPPTLQADVYLRDVEAGAAGFNEAWAEWLADFEAPGILVLEVRVCVCDCAVCAVWAFAGAGL